MPRFWKPERSIPDATIPGRKNCAIEIAGASGAICTSPSDPKATLKSPSMNSGNRNVKKSVCPDRTYCTSSYRARDAPTAKTLRVGEGLRAVVAIIVLPP